MAKKQRRVRAISTYLDCDTQYTLSEIYEILHRTLEEAKSLGYVNCKFLVESRYEPYEDSLGDPEFTIYGDRPLTQQEIKKEQYERKIEGIAKRKGITIYEARQYLNLLEKGVISEGSS